MNILSCSMYCTIEKRGQLTQKSHYFPSLWMLHWVYSSRAIGNCSWRINLFIEVRGTDTMLVPGSQKLERTGSHGGCACASLRRSNTLFTILSCSDCIIMMFSSISPLHLNLTAHSDLATLRQYWLRHVVSCDTVSAAVTEFRSVCAEH